MFGLAAASGGGFPGEGAATQGLANAGAYTQMREARDAQEQFDFDARNFNHDEAKLARRFQRNERERSQKWEERMSNSAHQRERMDLIKAGLNPLLSVNGGASTPSVGTSGASQASTSAGSAPEGVNPFTASLDAAIGKQNLEKGKKEMELTGALKAKALADAHKAAIDANVAQKNIPIADMTAKAYKAAAPIVNKIITGVSSGAKAVESAIGVQQKIQSEIMIAAEKGYNKMKGQP